MPDWVREEQRAFERDFPRADSSRYESAEYWPEVARQIDERRAWEARMAAMPQSPPPRTVSDEELIAWLGTKGPREWHVCAADWNWDKGLGPLVWILRQPGCDRGTAICIFARGEAGIFEKYESVEALRAKEGYYREQAEMLIELCERWAAGRYSEYRFDPEDDVRGVFPERMPWPVPEDLARAKARGERLDHRGWEEGVPGELIYGPPGAKGEGG
ncbi:MAG TPA: DUF4274 domain-containing protein [Allosphingosinicella sp.]|jgi:hypothetical protein